MFQPLVKILQYTPDPEKIIAQAARLCYSAAEIETIGERLTKEIVSSFLKKIISMGHHSALEHASFTFGIEKISRTLTHQLVRHRIASYSQQSQRYVVAESLHIDAIVPESIENHNEYRPKYQELMRRINELYQEMIIGGIPTEDARYILPNATPTKIVMTMNARELLHFFNLRCCYRAQWEIRKLANEMLKKVKEIAPNLFDHSGPECLVGPCPEGKYKCDKPISVVREEYGVKTNINNSKDL